MRSMTDHRRHDDAEAACAQLRDVLLTTRGHGRRDFLAALGRTAAGGALIVSLPGLATRALAQEKPVTAFVFGGVWKKSAMTAFGEPFTKKTGIAMQYQDPYTFAKLRAMHQA